MSLFKNRREKALAGFLAAVLAVLALAIGGRALMDFRRELETKIAQVEGQQLEAESWISDEAYWQGRGEWLASKQPTMGEPRQDSLELLQKIETAARSHGIEVKGRMIKELVKGSEFAGTPIRVDVAGGFSGLVGWLHELQQPGNFLLINELTIKASSKPDAVDCSIEVMRCYQPTSGSNES
jgi:hypothetical protein